MYAHFIDVGQGDATLLEFPCGAVMIDAGGGGAADTERLVTYLADFFARQSHLQNTLGAIFITHTHVDHNRSRRTIVEDPRIQVDRYVHNDIYDGSGRHGARWIRDHGNQGGRSIVQRAVLHSEVTNLAHRRGMTDAIIDPVACPSIDPELVILAGQVDPDPGWSPGELRNGNNHSLVVRVTFGRSSFLFTGDLEGAAIETLVDYYDGTSILDVDVYQVGHHGSGNGTTPSLVRSMSPKIAVISMSRWNDRRSQTAWAYGHPRQEAIQMLRDGIERRRSHLKLVRIADGVRNFHQERMKHAIYATGWDGTVVVRATSAGRFIVRRSR